MADEKSNDTSISMVLGINALSYSMPPDLSVVVSRADCNQFFQGSSFSPSSSGSCIWNTGSSYIDPKETYLILDVKNENDIVSSNTWFGKDLTACNLINRLTISSRSGVIIEQIANVNVLAAIRAKYEISSKDQAELSMAGALPAYPTGSGVSEWWPRKKIKRFSIPMTLLSPWFGSVNMLLPSSLASGLKFEFLFESALNALVAGSSGHIPVYSIVGARMLTSNYTLSDVVQRNLNQSAASSGLEIISSTYFSQSGSRSTNVVNLDVSKSVSRALSAFYIEKLDAADSTDSKLVSSPIVPTDYITECQWRVGSLYFPQSSVRTTEDGWEPSAVDLYIMALQSFGRKGCVTTLDRFMSDSAILGVSLERSTVTELAGIPLSNSRMLSLNVSWNSAPSARKYNVFLKHAVLIRCFANSISVEI